VISRWVCGDADVRCEYSDSGKNGKGFEVFGNSITNEENGNVEKKSETWMLITTGMRGAVAW
jgi:hypothetical protein